MIWSDSSSFDGSLGLAIKEVANFVETSKWLAPEVLDQLMKGRPFRFKVTYGDIDPATQADKAEWLSLPIRLEVPENDSVNVLGIAPGWEKAAEPAEYWDYHAEK